MATYMGYYPLANHPQEIDNALLRAQRTPAGSARRMVQDLVKNRVLNWMKDIGIGEWPDGRNLETVHVESDQRLVYRPDAPWRFNLLETEMVDGETRESVTLRQPLFSPAPWKHSSLLRVQEMIKGCWASAESCVVSQLSAHLGTSAQVLEEHVEGCAQGDQRGGKAAATQTADGGIASCAGPRWTTLRKRITRSPCGRALRKR